MVQNKKTVDVKALLKQKIAHLNNFEKQFNAALRGKGSPGFMASIRLTMLRDEVSELKRAC